MSKIPLASAADVKMPAENVPFEIELKVVPPGFAVPPLNEMIRRLDSSLINKKLLQRNTRKEKRL